MRHMQNHHGLVGSIIIDRVRRNMIHYQ
jgi:hypothetical protein